MTYDWRQSAHGYRAELLAQRRARMTGIDRRTEPTAVFGAAHQVEVVDDDPRPRAADCGSRGGGASWGSIETTPIARLRCSGSALSGSARPVAASARRAPRRRTGGRGLRRPGGARSSWLRDP